MTSSPEPRSPSLDAHLAREGRALRALARRLVRDDDDADDVVQDAYAAALTRGDAARGLGPWLHGTVRKLAAMLRRGTARRRAREVAAAARATAAGDPRELAQQAELARDVAAAVHALAEPYRSVVLLRFWHELEPAAIARELGVPHNTVRSQLQRGLAQLRAGLDRRHGTRARWSAPLLALTRPATRAAAPLAALGVTMSTKTLVGAASAVLLAAVLAWIALAPATPMPPTEPHDAQANAPAAAPALVAAQPAPRRDDTLPAAASPLALRVYPIERGRSAVQGRVVDQHGLPVADARVAIEPSPGSVHPLLAIGEDRKAPTTTTTDADGGFHFDEVPTGPWRAHATTADGRRGERAFALPHDAAGEALVVALDKRTADDRLRVLVVDAQDRSVPAARVELWHLTSLAPILACDRTADAVATTTADGSCTFAVPAATTVAVRASAAPGAGLHVLDDRARRDQRGRVRIVLGPGGGIRGQLTGAPPAMLRGLRVQAIALRAPGKLYWSAYGLAWTTAVVDGAFAFADLPAGNYALVLAPPHAVCLDLPTDERVEGHHTAWSVEVKAGATIATAMAVTAGGSMRGRVHTADGAPVVGARVRACWWLPHPNAPDCFELHGTNVWRLDFADAMPMGHPESHAETITDRNGEYRIDGLHAGPHRIDVFADGLSYDQRTRVPVTAGETVTVDHELAPAGVLQGTVQGVTYMAVQQLGAARPAQLAILPSSGLFTFAGLAAGDYVLARLDADFRKPLLELARARVDAGRTTWLDLRGLGDVRIRGHVVSADGTPVQGSVQLYSRTQPLRADGSFEFRFVQPLRRWFDEPRLHVLADGVQQQFPLPDAALAVTDWHGNFRLGAGTLRVHVRDAGGRPLGARLEFGASTGARGMRAVDASGEATLRGLPDGDWTLFAHAPDARFESATVRLPGATEVVLQAQPTAWIDAQLLDRHGRAVEGYPIAAAVWVATTAAPTTAAGFTGDAVRWFRGNTDEHGRTRICVPPGVVLVQFSGEFELPGGEPEPQIVTTTLGLATAVMLRLP